MVNNAPDDEFGAGADTEQCPQMMMWTALHPFRRLICGSSGEPSTSSFADIPSDVASAAGMIDGSGELEWRVRKAGVSDVRRLAQVGAATFLETFAGILDGDAIVDHCELQHSPASYADYFLAGGEGWLVEIEPGAAPVGFALLTQPDLPGASPANSDLELKRIYLLSKYQGYGMGAALMKEVVASARRAGAQRLLLGVYAKNDRAQAFYRKVGFVELTSRQFRVGSKEYADIVFELTLADIR